MKKFKPILIILVVIILGIFFMDWSLDSGLPYGKLNPKSELCRKPELFQNQDLCIKSGCIWGTGDLTGPPFCGAYK